MPSIDEVTPYARHVIQLLAGALTTHGFIHSSLEQMLVGAGVSVFTLVWAYFARRNAAPATP